MRRRFLTLTVLTAFALASCGVRGTLDTPPPMWGDKNKPEQSEQKPSDDNS